MRKDSVVRKVRVVVCLLVMAAVCGSSFGSSANFAGTTDNKWSTASNWLIDFAAWGPAPTMFDQVVVSTRYWPTGGSVVVDAPAACDLLQVGLEGKDGLVDVQNSLDVWFGGAQVGFAGTGTGTINLNSASGSLNLRSETGIGWTGNGVLNMSAGSITSSSIINIGYAGNATANISGGTINTASLWIATWGGSSTLNLSDGVITTDYLNFGTGTTGILNVTGNGKLILTSKNWDVVSWKDYFLNSLPTHAGIHTINAQMNIVGDTLEFTAIPEPATMAMLGLGGLLVMRRKK